ncbi:ribosomal-protein-alanine N-acetyltransferase [Streptomyces sp. AJS327]|uniref:ribosomal protein S18-alanine N-acetyltransferase n=1 Tax=Streptomyces sp. AJS327 TaxID=2545265 RepID=UPI0015DF1B2D|nr:ribosomal protein S18-alanine N-acetyltransferase [Streptomyces sp. AJS327]MBA0054135.1 ribosomal-protein-alanine N-acetyltransferase [Streptomyces sp. AJS327]
MRWWHIARVTELERRLFEEDAWSAGMLWSELAHARGPGATRRYLLAVDRDTGEIVGYAGLAAVSGSADVQTIGVLPSHRRAGLGARLLSALLSAATAFGCHEVLLEVRVDNPGAQRLYERFGFAPVGVRRGYYQPAGVDALVMRRTAESAGFPAPPTPLAPRADQDPHVSREHKEHENHG